MKNKLESKLNNVFSKYIRKKNLDENGNGHCFICKTPKNFLTLVCGHFIKSRYQRYKYSEINCHEICLDCNRIDEENQLLYEQAMIKEYGHEAINIMKINKYEHVHWTNTEIKEKIKYYKQKLKEL